MVRHSVGIIANPASGKDIRRIVTYSSPYDNQEKVNIIRRVIMALHAAGVRQVYYMPEYYNIVPRAIAGMYGPDREAVAQITFTPLEFNYMEMESDSVIAGEMMKKLGVSCIITLGGDGTNRAVAKGCGSVPLVPISTGTNNAFPAMVEGTTAGLAAGAYAMGACIHAHGVLEHRKRLELIVDGILADTALIDIVLLPPGHVGARAMWNADDIRQIFVTQCAPYSIGISAIPGAIRTITAAEPIGMSVIAGNGAISVKAPIAPGMISSFDIWDASVLRFGQAVSITCVPCMVALDGERNLQLTAGQTASVRLTADGPIVLNIEQALQTAAEREFFTTKH